MTLQSYIEIEKEKYSEQIERYFSTKTIGEKQLRNYQKEALENATCFLLKYFDKNNCDNFRNEIKNQFLFYMATGSGKTVVMSYLISILFEMMENNIIEKKRILILVPNEQLEKQIKETIESAKFEVESLKKSKETKDEWYRGKIVYLY